MERELHGTRRAGIAENPKCGWRPGRNRIKIVPEGGEVHVRIERGDDLRMGTPAYRRAARQLRNEIDHGSVVDAEL